ncbi:NADH-cytochrome b5 reductase-like [Coemansia sp. RSA 2049]|nr:NADH-cytochrome b5 reductase-like [Coemansia sp. RSA 2049]KAJ2522629.1 NADH-cytochrome b5 reductase-like [Coemansia sp. RSA 1939]KAJ2617672.1 NADH-cytochrome b5 reductase-like [Coemansia sp. RSA 1804]KAJ2695408.1 NADH-cytochrome b5 reductase-like [Coemansia sp. RSA 1285]
MDSSDGKPVNPAVQAVLEEIARAKQRAAERKREQETKEKEASQYGVVKQADGSVVLRLPPAPEKPDPGDCCNSGCSPCIMDMYWDRMRAHKALVSRLEERYRRIIVNGSETDMKEEEAVDAAEQNAVLLDPLMFKRVRVLHVDELDGRFGRAIVLEATARDFALPLGQHIHIRAHTESGPANQGEDQDQDQDQAGSCSTLTRPFTPVMLQAADGVDRPHLLVRLYEGNAMSAYLRQLRVGDSILVRGPSSTIGDLGSLFGSSSSSNSRLVLVAGGSGIAPIFQILQYAHASAAHRDSRIALVQCAHRPGGLWLGREIAVLARGMPHLAHTPVVSGSNGRLTEAALRRALSLGEGGGGIGGCSAVVCGPGAFNADVGRWLRAMGVRIVHAL